MKVTANPAAVPKMTTCIDTFEISYRLSQSEAKYIANRLHTVTHRKDWNAINHYLSINPEDKDSINKLEYEGFYCFVPGITKITLLKAKEKGTPIRPVYHFKICFRVKPERLITRQHSLRLFLCNPENFNVLQDVYADEIRWLFPLAFQYQPIDAQLGTYEDETPPPGAYASQNLSRLPYLGLCKIERIDITRDIVVNDPAKFVELARRSYWPKNRLTLNQKPYLLALNTVKGFKVYDKQKELSENHTRSPNLQKLLDDATGVIRIEYTLRKPNRNTINKQFGLQIPASPRTNAPYLMCGLIPFLSEDYGEELLYMAWKNHIGVEPWLPRIDMEKTIDAAGAKESIKETLKEVTFVISQKRSLQKGLNAYESGVFVHGRFIQGSEKTFKRSLTFLRKLSVQPLRIPDRWNIEEPIEADFRLYPSVHIGLQHLPRDRPGTSSAPDKIYELLKTKLIDIYRSYKPP